MPVLLCFGIMQEKEITGGESRVTGPEESSENRKKENNLSFSNETQKKKGESRGKAVGTTKKNTRHPNEKGDWPGRKFGKVAGQKSSRGKRGSVRTAKEVPMEKKERKVQKDKA